MVLIFKYSGLPDRRPRQWQLPIIHSDRSSIICDALFSRQNPAIKCDTIIEAFKARILEVKVNPRDHELFEGLRLNSIKMDNQGGSAPSIYDEFVVTPHCEAVLVAMGLYPHLAILDEDQTLLSIAAVFCLTY